ncbi:MAG: alpha-glucan family phosphorylase [Myxococcota bacterium]|nr:alpha-glucan family phosphorylase [Myxococcota bacterium]
MSREVEALRESLDVLARNAASCFQPELQAVFRAIDPARFDALRHSPVALLAGLDEARLAELATDRAFLARVRAARSHLETYLADDETWADRWAGGLGARPVAYFCAEFGLHESVPLYSGGLGVLAGDHIKASSDLGVPLVGVGLLYHHGYLTQRLAPDGSQLEEYPETDPRTLPIEPVDGVEISVQLRDRTLHARLWSMRVGRARLLLLDSDVPANTPEDRDVTAYLYGGDERIRIRQELLLGIGGVRALRALRIRPSVYHLNEGHSAFATLELLREHVVVEACTVEEAIARVRRAVVFTTHTPVPAGHDRFDPALVLEHLEPLARSVGMSDDELLGLGRVDPGDESESFCMTVLALKLSRRANAVSALHAEVSRRMWQPLSPGRPEHEVPIAHVTNGVHVATWMAPSIQALFARHAEPDWTGRQADPDTWGIVERIEDVELWATHCELKRELVRWIRERAAREAERRGEPSAVVAAQRLALDDDGLLVGFARRFATYKRATLLFDDPEALVRLVGPRSGRPVCVVIAGKAHPRDEGGKAMLRAVFQASRDERLLGRVVVLENYDLEVARRLVCGVDVWLNNPRRPLEASGTSGQKAVLNGVLHCSVLDGWWAEAYDGRNGFAIGEGLVHADPAVQDRRDAEDLIRVLRDQVLPLYEERDAHGVPRRWIERVKRAYRTLAWRFSAERMLIDYVREAYLPAAGLLQRGPSGI